MHIPVVRITLCMYICLFSIVHCFVCDPVLILVKPAPIGCPIKCLSLSLSLSNFKVTRDKNLPILTRIERFRTVTLVWIHWWLWNDSQSLKQHRRSALLLFKVICQILRSHGTKKLLILTQIEHFRTVTPVWIHQWLWNDAQSLT